jgi:hypothetical protein
MKGAFIVSSNENLYAQVEQILVDSGGRAAPDHIVQIKDDNGVLFTVFGELGEEFATDLAAGADETRGDIDATPTFSTSTSCWAECSSEEAFVHWISVIADARREPTWVLDGDGVLWTSSALDPTGVRL